MTPYEYALAKKLTQAGTLHQDLSMWRQIANCETFPEESILQSIIHRIERINEQFESQLDRYQTLSEERSQLAQGPGVGIKQLNDQLWAEICYQFKDRTVAHDLLKILYQKIYRFPLPDFPITRRKPLDYKDVRLCEDSYALLGQYHSWFIELLQIVHFTPLRLPVRLEELRDQASHYTTLTQQIMREAEVLRNLQLTRDHLYKQLNQAMQAARGRLLIYKREGQRTTN